MCVYTCRTSSHLLSVASSDATFASVSAVGQMFSFVMRSRIASAPSLLPPCEQALIAAAYVDESRGIAAATIRSRRVQTWSATGAPASPPAAHAWKAPSKAKAGSAGLRLSPASSASSRRLSAAEEAPVAASERIEMAYANPSMPDERIRSTRSPTTGTAFARSSAVAACPSLDIAPSSVVRSFALSSKLCVISCVSSSLELKAGDARTSRIMSRFAHVFSIGCGTADASPRWRCARAIERRAVRNALLAARSTVRIVVRPRCSPLLLRSVVRSLNNF